EGKTTISENRDRSSTHPQGNDIFLWRNASGSFTPSFSSNETWEQIRVRSPLVPRAKVVWFKEYVPRFSLIAWMSLLARLPNRMG
ncbi:unnamed protein product, partial [Arabidopsis halleri]